MTLKTKTKNKNPQYLHAQCEECQEELDICDNCSEIFGENSTDYIYCSLQKEDGTGQLHFCSDECVSRYYSIEAIALSGWKCVKCGEIHTTKTDAKVCCE